MRQSDNRFRQVASVVDIRGERLGHELQRNLFRFFTRFRGRFINRANRPPVQRRGDLQRRDVLRLQGIVAQSDLAADAEPMLFRLNSDIEVVARESKSLAIER